MPEPVTFVLGGAVLALVGWAAWTLSGGFTVERPSPETAYQRGLNALIHGDRDEAIHAFTETVQVDTDNVDAYIHLGNLLRERGEPVRALQLHRELLVRAGRTATQEQSVREALVLDWIALGRPGEAVEEALELRELNRKNGSALKLLLRAYEAASDWERAVETRAELARQNGERGTQGLARYRAAIGENLLREGRVEDATRHFKSALRIQKNHPASLLRLGDIYYNQDRTERALVLWKGLALAHPDRSHLVLDRLETAYFEGGRFGEMSRLYEEMLTRHPRDARVLLALARMHMKRGDLPEATRALNEALEIDPNSLRARVLLIHVYRRRGELSHALDELEVLLQRLDQGERFVCASCGTVSEEYWSRCPSCLSWSTAS